jgi:UDP:flavonoid glycosyltransferase YjiC (YdhE family)
LKTRRALLVWELGGGRGHILHLSLAATALARQRFACTAAVLVHVEHAHEIALQVERIRQAPRLRFFEFLRRQLGHRSAATYADWLGDHGLFSADLVLGQMLAWKNIYEEEQPDLVIGEQSPLALLTARAMGIACAAIGIGFTLPPPHLSRYPPYFPENTEPLWCEAQLTEAVNVALAKFGDLRLVRLPQIYDCDAAFVCTPALYDPHAEARATRSLPPNLPRLDIVERPGDEVFVYLSTSDRHDPVILAAVMSLRLPKRIFAPAFNQTLTGPMQEYEVVVENTPVPPQQIAARSRVALHAGNHGTASLCLRTGLPFVAIPQQMEHKFNATRAEAAGVGRLMRRNEITVPDIHRAIHEIYESAPTRQRAIELAHRVAPEFADDPADLIAGKVAALFR